MQPLTIYGVMPSVGGDVIEEIFYDSFTDTDNTNLTDHTPETDTSTNGWEQLAALTILRIIGNQAQWHTSWQYIKLDFDDQFSDNYSFRFTPGATVSSQKSRDLRSFGYVTLDGSGNMTEGLGSNLEIGNNNPEIWEYVGGVKKVRDSTLVWNSGQATCCFLNGEITLYKNGVFEASYDTNDEPDTPITPTGLIQFTVERYRRFSDITIWNTGTFEDIP